MNANWHASICSLDSEACEDKQKIQEKDASMAISPTGTTLIMRVETPNTERRVTEDLDILVMHDDGHGTAVVSGAATIDIENLRGLLADVLAGVEARKPMARDPIVFAMANPTPVIVPDIAAASIAVMGTGRSDFPNHVNNLLAFPKLFRGALDARASRIPEQMKLAAASAIAAVIGDERSAEYVIPSVFDSRVVHAEVSAVREEAIEEGLARRALFVQDEDSMLATAKY
jgi:malic enzyme